MKPFNLELAKAGRPVQTKDGRPVRIICYDRKNVMYPIIALIKYDDREDTQYFDNNGKCWQGVDGRLDLVMVSTKKEGWINVYKNVLGTYYCRDVYSSKEEAVNHIGSFEDTYIVTTKIEWQE